MSVLTAVGYPTPRREAIAMSVLIAAGHPTPDRRRSR
jgi:hypothetical protein